MKIRHRLLALVLATGLVSLATFPKDDAIGLNRALVSIQSQELC